jgi:hypothetical protein
MGVKSQSSPGEGQGQGRPQTNRHSTLDKTVEAITAIKGEAKSYLLTLPGQTSLAFFSLACWLFSPHKSIVMANYYWAHRCSCVQARGKLNTTLV